MHIYKTTNLINGKIYIGQTNGNNSNYFGSGQIIKQAIKKYGKKNFVCEILEYCDSIEEMNEKEIFWIKYYNSQDKSVGYNIVEGGGGTKGYKWAEEDKIRIGNQHRGKIVSDVTRQKLSESHKNQKPTDEHKRRLSEFFSGSNHPNAKMVYQYDMEWNFINSYDCLKDAADSIGIQLQNISAVCRCVRESTANYRWSFEMLHNKQEIDDYYFRMTSRTKRKIKPVSSSTKQKLSTSHINQSVKVYQYDIDGEFIAEYNSIHEAMRITGSKHIAKCCQKKMNYKTSGGFIWSFEKF